MSWSLRALLRKIFIKGISVTKKISLATFNPWKNKILEIINKRIAFTPTEKQNVFLDDHVSGELYRLYKSFVCCPISCVQYCQI